MWEEKSRNYFRINGLCHLVRSEGGRICCDFNSLSERTGEKGSDQTERYLSRSPKSPRATHTPANRNASTALVAARLSLARSEDVEANKLSFVRISSGGSEGRVRVRRFVISSPKSGVRVTGALRRITHHFGSCVSYRRAGCPWRHLPSPILRLCARDLTDGKPRIDFRAHFPFKND